jgi:hypothetical protein
MNRRLLTLILLLLFAAAPLQAADGFSSLEEQMSGKEFTAAGLDKLSKEELDALNGWIRRHSLATLDTPRPVASGGSADAAAEDSRGFEKKKKKKDDGDRSTITSRLVGSFSGWDGQTVFKLENGMIWAQSDKDKFFTKEMQNPVVVIEPGMFGTWHLHIEGFGSECRVKRIQ